MYYNRSRAILLAALSATALTCGPEVAFAQEGGNQGLQDIVVTARKRAENLQNVASSISALSTLELERRFDSDVRDFAGASPNVVIDDIQQGPGGVASIYIRGIGVADVEKSVDPAVGVVIDDIYVGQSSGSLLKAIDIDRVEVLRGPQGTLFGRNAAGGVINLSRSRPTQELSGKARLTYGRFNTATAEGVISFGLAENLALKVSGAYETSDGYFYNRTHRKHGQTSRFWAVGAQLLFTPTDRFEFSVSYDRQETRQDPGQLLSVPRSTDMFCTEFDQCSPSPGVPTSGDRYESLVNGRLDRNAWFHLDMAIGKANYDLGGDFDLTYILGHLKTSEDATQDWDGSALTLYHTDRPARWRQTTHELRLSKGGSGPLTFVLGGYLWDSKYTINLKNYIGFGGAPMLTSAQDVSQTTKSYAVFFEGDYRLTDKLKLTLGARYTRDRKSNLVNDGTIYLYDSTEEVDPYSIIEPSVENGSIVMTDRVRQSWSKFTPKVSLSYDWTGAFMTYALWSRGYRSGGFNGQPATLSSATIPYNPETLDNFEAGFKSELFDRRLRVNASIYLMKYKDMQQHLSVPAPGASTQRESRIINASKADLKGFEIDFTSRLNDNFSLNGNIGYLDSKYKDFVGDIYNNGTPIDATFLKLRRAPKWTWNLGATYEADVGPGSFWVTGMVHYLGAHELTFHNNPNLRNKGQYIVDASINYKINNTTISLFGKNLAKENGWTVGYDVQGIWSYAAPRPPRVWGVAATQVF